MIITGNILSAVICVYFLFKIYDLENKSKVDRDLLNELSVRVSRLENQGGVRE